MKVGVYKVSMSNPGDVSGLRRLIDAGKVDPSQIVASIGKTEGNGGANDFTRALATLSFSRLLAEYTGGTPEEVAAHVAFVWSGGCEGVLSPHATFFTREDDAGAVPGEPRLALSVQRTRDFKPEEVGRMIEVEEVAEATRRAIAELAVTNPADVHYVQVKGPLLTPAGIKDAAQRGAQVVTADPNRSKAFARGATALGVALALGEVPARALREEVIAADMNLFSQVASTSAGGELVSCEVLVFANSPRATSGFRIGHAALQDAIDADGVRAALRSAGLQFDCDPDVAQRERIAAVFAKAEAPPTGELRGRRTTMLSDADINYERHARAAVGAVIASITGDPAIFVSGGTEHQSPPGQAPIAAIVAC
ncbi:MAG: cyanuric acid amidohydrolase [Candidatus Acidiferrales bacterium]